MLAKILAAVKSIAYRREVKWQTQLPERFVHSTSVASVPNETEMKAITRGLSSQLDALAAQFGTK